MNKSIKVYTGVLGLMSRDGEFDDILIPPIESYHVANPDPIQLDSDGKVTVLIKTLDGDVRI